MKTSEYTKSGSSPPRTARRAWTTPGFHADTRKPDERERVDQREAAHHLGSGARWGRMRRFVMFVPETRYHPGREEYAWTAERLRLLD
jgi:hypothetical protein